MINFLKGTVLEHKDHVITLDVQGIGFALHVAQNHTALPGESLSCYVYLHWNQENGPTLFGFHTELEKSLFLMITSCSGIGPKIALAILSAMRPTSFLKAIQTGDEKALSTINGIGTKKAEQMIVNLRHKAAKLLESGIMLDDDVELEQWNNISQVLTSLNYSRNEVTNALHHLKEAAAPAATFDQLLRKALSFLSKRV